MQQQEFIDSINQDGIVLLKNVIDASGIQLIENGLMSAIEEERLINNDSENPFFDASLLPFVSSPEIARVFDNEQFLQPFDWCLGKDSIVYACISACIKPNKHSYTARIHRDSNVAINDFRMRFVALIMLSDFTVENGSTYFLKGSHRQFEQPTHDDFYGSAEQITGQAGDVIYFDPLIWHAAGENKTDERRNALLIGMVHPWMKQWIDIPAAFKEAQVDTSNFSDVVLEKLGFRHQTPRSVKEFHRAEYKDNWLKKNKKK